MPKTYIGDIANFPAVLLPLIEQPHWVAWRWVRKNSKWTKPPYRADDPARLASTDDPRTWNCFSSAVKAVIGGQADGVGFALTNSGIAAVDLDHCRDAETGAIDDWAADLISRAPGAYTEVTASGSGLRIIGRGAGAELHKKFEIKNAQDGAAVELYRRATRYITVSGLEIGACDELPDIDSLLDHLAAEHTRSRGNGSDGERTIRDIIKHGSPVGQRSRDFNRVIWSLAGMGRSVDEIEQRLAQYPNGIAAKYAGRLREEIERCYVKWERANDTGTTGASWDDPDESILDESRGELPSFPLDTLAPHLAEWAERNATTAGSNVDHVVVPFLGIAGGLIGAARSIEAKPGWAPPCVDWYAIVGESGTGKTPGLNASREPLARFEYDRRGQIDEMRREHETKQKAAEFALEQWEEACEKAAANKQSLPPKPAAADKLPAFMEPMLAINDPTIEALAKRLQFQKRGLLFIRDELSGLFSNMARYSNGGDDRPFWLEAWNGGPYSVDRASKPAIRIPRLLVGIVGGFQPDKVARAFQGDQDGFYARMLMVWPLPSAQSLTREGQTFDEVTINAIKALVDLNDDAPAVKLTASAWEIFRNFRNSCIRQMQATEGRARQWLAKAPDHALRVAGTLTFLEWAMLDAAGRGEAPKEVTQNTMERAARLVGDYFMPHTLAAIRLIGATSQLSMDREVLKWIASNGLAEISVKDIRRDCLKQVIDNKQTVALLDRLCTAGWLREVTEPTGKRGRTARRWQVNPTLLS